jgi:hypothetical protein
VAKGWTTTSRSSTTVLDGHWGEEVGFGCGEVWAFSGHLYIGRGAGWWVVDVRWSSSRWCALTPHGWAGAGYWRIMGEEAKRRRFPCAGGDRRRPWWQREVGKWRRLSLPQLAGRRRKGWPSRPGPKGRVGRILCCENKRKFGWVAWWAGPNTRKNKKIVF